MRTLILSAVFLLLPVASLATASHHDYSRYTHWATSFQTGGETLSSVVSCDIQGTPCFATLGETSGLTMFSVNGGAVTQEGNLALPGSEVDVDFDGYLAYVVSRPNRLAQVLVFTPQVLSLSWESILPHTPEAVAMSGAHVLIACGSDGLLVFDPTIMFGNPVGVVASWAGTARDIAMSGTTAIILTDTGITALDVSDPLNPVEMGSFAVSDPLCLAVSGTMAYVGQKATPGTGGRVQELDFTDPNAIAAGRAFSQLGDYDVTALDQENDLLITTGTQDLKIIDLLTGTVAWDGVGMTYPKAVAHIGDTLGMATLLDGFHVYDRRDPASPPVSPVFGVGGALRDLQIVGDFAFGNVGTTLYCFDLTPEVPTVAWSHTLAGSGSFVTDLLVQGGRIYVGYLSGDVEILAYDGVSATELGTFNSGGFEVTGLGLLGDDLAVLLDPIDDGFIQAEIHVYDVADPAAPALLDTYRNDQYPNMLAEGTTIVLYNEFFGSGILLLDASDPSNLVEAATLVTDPLPVVSRHGNVLYIVSDLNLRPVDISDPWVPLYGSLRKVPADSKVVAWGNAGYMTKTDLVLDLSDPMAPVALGSVSTPVLQQASSIAVGDGYLVLARGSDNVLLGSQGQDLSAVNDLPGIASEALAIQAGPNPFNPRVRLSFTMTEPGRATVEIYDLAGRKVANLDGYFTEPGPAVFDWDGRSDTGRDLPSGIYLVRAADNLRSGTRKIALVR